VPLVIGLHGAGGTGEEFDGASASRQYGDEQGFATVFPTAASSRRFWSLNRAASPDDVPRIEALLDAIEALGCTDPDRVYATGVSNGGGFAARLGCELSDRIAAVAPVAGGYRALDAARAPGARRCSRSTAWPTTSSPTAGSRRTSRVTSPASSPAGAPERLRVSAAAHTSVARCHPVALPQLRGRHGGRAHRDRRPGPRLVDARQRGDLEVRRRAPSRRLNESDAKASRLRSPPAGPPKRSDSLGGGLSPRGLALCD
jgi:poly(3-hydroxybutyrate) depolymerase